MMTLYTLVIPVFSLTKPLYIRYPLSFWIRREAYRQSPVRFPQRRFLYFLYAFNTCTRDKIKPENLYEYSVKSYFFRAAASV